MKFEQLVQKTDSRRNYICYRQASTSSSRSNSVFIPVFSLVLRDLGYMYNSIPNKHEDGTLNLPVQILLLFVNLLFTHFDISFENIGNMK